MSSDKAKEFRKELITACEDVMEKYRDLPSKEFMSGVGVVGVRLIQSVIHTMSVIGKEEDVIELKDLFITDILETKSLSEEEKREIEADVERMKNEMSK